MKTNPNDPAHSYGAANVDGFEMHEGLTKREYFASQAMIGYFHLMKGIGTDPAKLASRSVVYADALIEALNEEK